MSVIVNVVINQEFNDRYEDQTSFEYKEFVQNFTTQMKRYYLFKKISNVEEVLVINVRRGNPLVRLSDETVGKMRLSDDAIATIYRVTADGVSVTHDVVLAIPNSGSFNQQYGSDLKAITSAVVELVGCLKDCPYNLTAEPKVEETELDIKSICKSHVSNAEVAQYYTGVTHNGVFTCVTVCDGLHPKRVRCYNKGLCRMYGNAGPRCHCQHVNDTWYLGEDCQFPIVKTAFYVGLSITFACLLAAVGALTAFLLFNKHKQTLRRDNKKQQVSQWLAEDFEWSRPNSANNTRNAVDYRNPAFTHEESAVHSPEPVDYRRPAPVYQLNGPALDAGRRQWSLSAGIRPSSPTAHGHNGPFSNAGLSQSTSLNLREFPHNPIWVNRATRTSWDA
ncbi:mucin-3A [Pseudoliparis swirei]|uniref:mucin-3A n=1 Tax=Pseudoliparis swirei TaxID=2059687 RepID=UPI0024BE28E9|nr:mucin-3A [Pseudoliparis swirei]